MGNEEKMGAESERLQALRQRAIEQQQQQQQEPEEVRSQEEILEDLRIHQVELEMQNESLQQSELQHKRVAEQYIELFELIPMAVIVIDSKGYFQQINRAGYQLLGLDASHSKFHRMLIPFLSDLQFMTHLRHTIHAPRHESGEGNSTGYGHFWGETELVDQQKNVHQLEVTAYLQDRGEEEPHYLLVLNDLTERALMERQLAKAELERDSRESQDEFLASMSHELRTPLSSIIGNCDLLLEVEQDSDKRRMLKAIEFSGESQLALVNDILDMSKIDSGKFTIENHPYLFSELLKASEQLVRQRAVDAGLILKIEDCTDLKDLLLGDKGRVGQILLNMLSNAIKFTGQGGEVTLTAWVEHKTLMMEVSDTGVGMSPEGMRKLFGRFEQEDKSISRRFGGSGLGLYISLNLAEMMGGSIDVTSELGVGSRFRLTLPVNCSGKPLPGSMEHKLTLASTRADVAAIGMTLLRGHLLLAEDTPELQMLAQRILERMGVTVEVANNGKEALERVAEGTFDLILMDMQMPGMDGIEACRTLREQGNQIPVIALTANVMQKHRDRFEEAGCNGFVSKPIDRQLLHHSIASFLSPAS